LLFARGALALFLLVKIAAIILDAADGRDCVGRYLDQIQPAISRNSQRLKGRQNSKLDAVFIDDADFACADALVNASKRLGRTFVECDGTPPKILCACLWSDFAAVGPRMHSEYSIVPVLIKRSHAVVKGQFHEQRRKDSPLAGRAKSSIGRHRRIASAGADFIRGYRSPLPAGESTRYGLAAMPRRRVHFAILG
jgi:hypothetical protein